MAAKTSERVQHRSDRGRVRQQEHRDTRAWKLYRHITGTGAGLDEVRLWDDDEWTEAGRAAGLNPRNLTAGPETRGQVIGYLTQFAAR